MKIRLVGGPNDGRVVEPTPSQLYFEMRRFIAVDSPVGPVPTVTRETYHILNEPDGDGIYPAYEFHSQTFTGRPV